MYYMIGSYYKGVEKMICKKCGHKLPEDSEFCQYCGNTLKSGFVISAKVLDCDEEETQRSTETRINGNSQTKGTNNNVVNDVTKNLTSNKKIFGNINLRGKGIITLSLVAIVALLISIVFINFYTAQEKAENVVAVYLVDKTIDNYSSNYSFTSFEKTYYTVDVSNFKYIVKLSGSAYIRRQSGTVAFSAIVKINPFSGKASITKIILDGKKIK